MLEVKVQAPGRTWEEIKRCRPPVCRPRLQVNESRRRRCEGRGRWARVAGSTGHLCSSGGGRSKGRGGGAHIRKTLPKFYVARRIEKMKNVGVWTGMRC
ncbi:hypothetical protein Pmani_012956 [Petrolisthes manimaculis]|uniref:Uncharacterized protein n=1 Tax=Petrolisthes manimaculis TaxID=1843537 RepID=A0AAE1PYD8_9EUCA|nr:hypothetical protein Pmani_012956 [Petrolisthes manimaculis]